MKKIALFFSLFCLSFAAQAQNDKGENSSAGSEQDHIKLEEKIYPIKL